MKNSFRYVILILLFIALVISLTVSNLYIKYETKGNFNYSKKYHYIKYSNISMSNDDVTVKINENDNSIHFDIPSLEREASIALDITNIGSSEVVLDNYSIININTNLDKNNIEVVTSLNKDTIIKGGESKKLIINIKNNNKESGHYNFNINCLFKES